MLLLIIFLVVFCPGILLIWMCWCNASTAKNTKAIKEALVKPTNTSNTYKSKSNNIVLDCVLVILIGGLIIAGIIWIL